MKKVVDLEKEVQEEIEKENEAIVKRLLKKLIKDVANSTKKVEEANKILKDAETILETAMSMSSKEVLDGFDGTHWYHNGFIYSIPKDT